MGQKRDNYILPLVVFGYTVLIALWFILWLAVADATWWLTAVNYHP
jgi:ABC-type transporter Mla subunit MlaD